MRRLLLAGIGLAAACRFDPSYRDVPGPNFLACTDGRLECLGGAVTRCDSGDLVVLDACAAQGMACTPDPPRCTPCAPNEALCEGSSVVRCDAEGQERGVVEVCDVEKGSACIKGACVDLCAEARAHRSNVGCEFWPVDLDNAVVAEGSAAARTYAVVVANPEGDLAATVTIEEDLAPVGKPASVRMVATATIEPGKQHTLKLGSKEVDGSTAKTPNDGSGTALGRRAYRLRSNLPVVAYQVNPLADAKVLSSDATVLLPTAALEDTTVSYLVAGWPQTSARTDTPATSSTRDLRAFLTVVGTRPNTKVTLRPTARVIPGGPFPKGIARGTTVQTTLQPFEVLNLETGDFLADFTGSTVTASAPVVAYVGSEASAAPLFTDISARSCCDDHLESQVVPLRALGRHYVLGQMPKRSQALATAGLTIRRYPEPELYRIVATAGGKTTVTTTLDAPAKEIVLDGPGASVIVPAYRDFILDASSPVLVADIQVGQEAAGISVASGLPGGGPSLVLVPAVEQWRSEYVMVTPEGYAFDFLVITALRGAAVQLDGSPVDATACDLGTSLGPYAVYRCPLSAPLADPTKPHGVAIGKQRDGVHRVQSDVPVGVVAYGFDYRISYAYPAGTNLSTIDSR